jgi:hypothetical protein
VDDFDTHLPMIEGFHRRYMASNKAAARWVRSAAALSPKMIAPQHGAVYRAERWDGSSTGSGNWNAVSIRSIRSIRRRPV